jgi:ABC-type Zn uptake system ZnuABC Zn-binding protein ZnuA
MYRFIVLLTLVALAACEGQTSRSDASQPSSDYILTSTTILADITRNIAGDRLTVESLLPVGTDPHSYQPVPQDATRIRRSSVLVINGAEYEHFLESLIESAGGERALIEASAGLGLRTDAAEDHAVDPHLWLDPVHVKVYADNIRDGLTRFDPDGAEDYQSNASAYIEQLTELDAWINEQVAQIEPERRVLVTNHEALGYFADRYGFTVVGTILQSFSSSSAPSARQMADLIEQIEESRVPAIFLDAADNPALARQIAGETGAEVVMDLHLESLTDGPPAATYIELMRHNVTRIVEALR